MKSREMKDLFDAMFHGKYEFADFLNCDVRDNYSPLPWSNRTIYRPDKKLKDFHKLLNNFIFEYLPINERVTFAYRKGANPRSAFELHNQSKAFYQTDLVKFFDSITIDLIRDVLVKSEAPASDFLNYLDRILQMVTVDNKLPIGFSTSPLLSNACFKKFDDIFEEYCNDHNLIYSRYADDIIISCQDRSCLIGIEEIIGQFLKNEFGNIFKINRTKSKLTTVGRKVKVLGLVLLPTGRITIDVNIKKQVECQLHFYINDRKRLLDIFEKNIDEGNMDKGLQKLSGYISHIKAADPDYFNKIRKKYGATIVDGMLHRSIK